MSKSSKGFSYERTLAKQLSIWWTQDVPEGAHDDVFWRTSQSGGRATSRLKKKRPTKNQHSDLCAIDPIGQPLLDLCVLEIKRGYSRATIHDLLDCPDHAKEQIYAEWFRKAEKSRKAAGAYFWLVISKRDQREPLIFIPSELYDLLFGVFNRWNPPTCTLEAEIGINTMRIVGIQLQTFFTMISPKDIRGVLEQLRGRNVSA